MSKLHELLMALEEHRLGPKECEELKSLLAHPDNRAQLVEHFHNNEIIISHFAERDSDVIKMWADEPNLSEVFDRRVKKGPVKSLKTGRIIGIPLPITAVAASVLMLVIVGIALFNPSNRSDPRVARLSNIRGEVRVLLENGSAAADSNIQLRPGMGLFSKDETSGAVLTYSDGSWVRIEGNTKIVNRTTENGCSLFIEQGRIEASLQKQKPNQPFVFSSVNAEVVVVGTKLRLEVREGSTRLLVREGSVKLLRRTDGETVEVKGGFQAWVNTQVNTQVPLLVTAVPVSPKPQLPQPGPFSISDSSPIIYYSFEGFNGNRVVDQSNGVFHATIRSLSVGSLEMEDLLARGKKGRAFRADQAFLEIDQHETLNPEEISLSLWFRVTQPDAEIVNPKLIGKATDSDQAGFTLEGFDSVKGKRTDELRFKILTNRGVKEVLCTVDKPERWTHIALTFNREMLKMYLNGRKVDVAETGSSLVIQGPMKLKIGKFIGFIDEVRLYNRTLLESEIADLVADLSLYM